MRTKREVLDRLQADGNIYKFFASRLKLKPAMRRHQFMAICPLHPDHRPSLSINTALGVFFCHGCGAGGDIFTFRMKIESLTFPECLEAFARELGLSDEGSAK